LATGTRLSGAKIFPKQEEQMAEVKTKVNNASVTGFLNRIADEQKRQEAFVILKLMTQVTKTKPKMWGTSIIGFGKYHYKGASGREGDWFITGFSPRKQNLTVYINTGFGKYGALLKKLGKHKTSAGGCLYINRLDDIHLPTLRKLVQVAVRDMRKIAEKQFQHRAAAGGTLE
jgi:hypothetical protein